MKVLKLDVKFGKNASEESKMEEQMVSQKYKLIPDPCSHSLKVEGLKLTLDSDCGLTCKTLKERSLPYYSEKIITFMNLMQ